MKRESWLPAAPESAALARAAVREAALGLPEVEDGALWQLMLATSEAVANAVEHGAGCRVPGPGCEKVGGILLVIEVTDGGVFVEVCDCGVFGVGVRALDLESVRGRGMPIIAAVVDHLEVMPASDRTRIRFSKRLAA